MNTLAEIETDCRLGLRMSKKLRWVGSFSSFLTIFRKRNGLGLEEIWLSLRTPQLSTAD